MTVNSPIARYLAESRSSSGITLAQGAFNAPRARHDERDLAPRKPPCEAPQGQRLRATPPAAVAAKPTMPRPAPVAQPAPGARKMPLMRRYEVTSLSADGLIETSRHVAPATAQFESAFSAFARGTLMSTSQGLCAIEDLLPGMEIETAEYGLRPVLWIGSMTILPGAPVETPEQTRMTRIMADTFGMARPMADLIAGPGARLLHRPAALRELNGTGPRSGQVFTPVSDFEDGMQVIRITPPRPVTVYHLCLDRHASIKVSGMDLESFHPGLGLEQRMGPNMLSLFLSLFPHIRHLDDFGALAHPRATLETLASLTAA